MSHILICSYEYGMDSGPEGICTYRLASALKQKGHKVTVITSDIPTADFKEGIISLPTKALKPSSIFLFIEKVINRILWSKHNLSWIFRVATSKDNNYDLIYGRSMPLMSNIAAWLLSMKLSKPLMLHFSDPPLSPWVKFPTIAYIFVKSISKTFYKSAISITFTTEEAIGYTEKRMGWRSVSKAHVLSHVAPDIKNLDYQNIQENLFIYAGGIYGKRDPEPLLMAFKALIAEKPDACLHFYGTKNVQLEKCIEKNALNNNVKIFPFTRDIDSVFSKANVLVALDAFEDEALFISTKIIDYYMVNRPVLLLSPKKSPTSQLSQKFLNTVQVSENDEEKIFHSMQVLLNKPINEYDFKRRFLEMRKFSIDSIVEKFEIIAELQ